MTHLCNERIEKLIALHDGLTVGGPIAAALRELLSARERIAKLEDEREGLREMVDHIDEGLPKLSKFTTSEHHLLACRDWKERRKQLRARIGRTASGEWSDEGKGGSE